MCRSRIQKIKIGPLGEFEKSEKIAFITIIGHFDPKWPFLPKLTLGPKTPPRYAGPALRVEHKTCSAICGTPVQAILDQKSLTRLAGPLT